MSSICSYKCCGYDNYDGGCCSIEDRDFIIGPHKDYDLFLQKLSKKLDMTIRKDEIFIDYVEGKNLFPDKITWQSLESYPAFRVDLDSDKKYCIFYNKFLKFCTVYDIRPNTCQIYKCDYLKNNS